ncbi:TetR family transcriptional regulator [Streptomyces sp. NPDC056296]|uniref:TetR family transcriptional regulator n=1 Tax=Streptomyces sp. NPDC056296 TaxID=3345775 RepID=UPI0035DD3F55
MMDTTQQLSAETILATTEEVLRRHGPAKATVADVARALGVSPGSVFRHFKSKAALREAVTRRWIIRTQGQPALVVADTSLPPHERLHAWLRTVFAVKRATAAADPELFATYCMLVAEHRDVVTDHVGDLIGQLGAIIADGAATGDFATSDPEATARAIFGATTRFHHPAHAEEWHSSRIEQEFDDTCLLLLDGLRAR